MHIVVAFLFVCKFIDHCQRVKIQLQLINIVLSYVMYEEKKNAYGVLVMKYERNNRLEDVGVQRRLTLRRIS